MQTHSELWKLIEPLVLEEGLELYDIERGSGSGGKGGVVRIFLSKPKGEKASENSSENSSVRDGSVRDGSVKDGGIQLEDCASISRKISSLDRFEEIIPEQTTLEVSSPGINRKLRRDEHFISAIGEHIWVKGVYTELGVESPEANGVKSKEKKEKVVRGVLKQFKDDSLLVEEDKTKRELVFDVRDIVSARIDFVF